MTQIKSAGVIGAGVIGSGWIARLLLNGVNVCVFDPAKEAPKNVDKVIQNAERAYKNLLKSNLPKKGTLTFSTSVSEVAKSSELIKRIINKYIRNHSSTIFYALIMMIVSSAATGFHAWLVQPALDYVLINSNNKPVLRILECFAPVRIL